MDKIAARLEALRLAMGNAHAESVEETVERAERYCQFLVEDQSNPRPELKPA